jgi:hypothetical protein
MTEPQDHALGRSQGGFGTKVSLVCCSIGILLAVTVTPGQRHESQAFAEVMGRARRPRRAGRQRWPAKAAADKGYSYPGIRDWLRRHHIEPVIPTRKNQAREEGFDKACYRQRNIIERVVGLVQGMPCSGHPLRQVGRQLCSSVDRRKYPLPPAKVYENPRKGILRNNLVAAS